MNPDDPDSSETSSPGRSDHIRSYVLRQGRKTRSQERALADLSPQFVLPFHEQGLDFPAIFGNPRPVILEIGFGMGHATAEIARSRPEFNYLGAEVHTPGVGALLDKIGREHLANVRIIQHDVVAVLQYMVPVQSLAGVHVFFPDPWRKTKHFKRRLIQRAFLEHLASRCQPGAYLYLVTDWADYADWMLVELAESPSWTILHGGFSPPVPWRPVTKFEKKGLAKDHVIREIMAVRR